MADQLLPVTIARSVPTTLCAQTLAFKRAVPFIDSVTTGVDRGADTTLVRLTVRP